MKTDDLIKALSADNAGTGPSLGGLWAAAILTAALVAAAAFTAALGARPDIGAAAETMRFLFKFVVTGLLVVTALPALVALSRPEPVGAGRLAMLLAAPLALAVAVATELMMVSPADWGTRLIGVNSPECLYLIGMIGIGPLALFVLALRRAAPERPQLAGAVAGLAAGGIAATLYAAHCTDDSPLFVATWYSIAILTLAGLGAVSGRVFARW
jgi:hypothetical protein